MAILQRSSSQRALLPAADPDGDTRHRWTSVHLATDGGSIMLRKSAIGLAAVARVRAGSTLGASARGGGGFGGMGHGGFGGMGHGGFGGMGHAGFARGVGSAPHAMGVGR